MSTSHPFPFLTGGALGLTIRLVGTSNRRDVNLVRIPDILSHVIRIRPRNGHAFMFLRSVVTDRYRSLFGNYRVLSVISFEMAHSDSLSLRRSSDISLVGRIRRSLHGHGHNTTMHLRVFGAGGGHVGEFLRRGLSIARVRICRVGKPLSPAYFFGFVNVGNV